MAASKPVVRRATPVTPKAVPRSATPTAPTRLQVVNRSARSVSPAAPSVPLPPSVPSPRAGPSGGALGIEGMVGVAAVVVAATVLVLNFTLPWSTSGNGFGPNRDRADVVENFKDGTFYLHGLTLWPVVLTILGIIAGAALTSLDFLDVSPRGRRAFRLLVEGALAVLGFELALMGARFLGIMAVRSYSDIPGDSALAAPWVNLFGGLVLLGLAAWRLLHHLWFVDVAPATPAMRITFLSIAILAAALILNPFFPLATTEVTGAGTVYVGEAAIADAKGFLQKAGDDLRFALASFWVAFYVLLASAVAAVAARESPNRLWTTLVQVQAFNVVPLVIGLIFSILLYTNLDRSTGGFGFGITVSASFNFIPPIAFIALLVTFGWYATKVLGPFVREAARDEALAVQT